VRLGSTIGAVRQYAIEIWSSGELIVGRTAGILMCPTSLQLGVATHP